MSQGYFFTIQDAKLAPPEMPNTRTAEDEWMRVSNLDKKKYNQHANKKQKVVDDIDIFLSNEKSKYNTAIRKPNHNPPQMAEEWRTVDFLSLIHI